MILKVVQTKGLEENKQFLSQIYYEGKPITMLKTPEGFTFNVHGTDEEVEIVNIPPFDLDIPSDFAVYLMEGGKTIDAFYTDIKD